MPLAPIRHVVKELICQKWENGYEIADEMTKKMTEHRCMSILQLLVHILGWVNRWRVKGLRRLQALVQRRAERATHEVACSTSALIAAA